MGSKLRPTLVLCQNGNEVTVCFITSQVIWKTSDDIEVLPSLLKGLRKISLIRASKISTLEKSLVVGKLGELNLTEIKTLNKKIIQIFQLEVI